MNHLKGEEQVSFRSHVAPILLEQCIACHSAKKAEGGYRVDTFEELLKPGDSGESPLTSHSLDASELFRRIVLVNDSERMPAESDPLSADSIELIRNWVEQGANFDGEDQRQWLPFVIPPKRYPPPPSTYARPIPVMALVFTPDEKHIIAGGYHELTVWDTETAALVRRIDNIGQRVYAIAASHDGELLAVGCGEPGHSGEVRLINASTGKVLSVVARSSDVVLDVAFRPGSDELAVAAADNVIRVINVKTLEELHTLASHADWVTSVAWSDDGRRLASSSRDKSAKVFDIEGGQLIASYQGHGAAVRGVTFMPTGEQVLSTGSDNKLHRWNIADVKRVASIDLGGEGYKLARGDGFVLVPCADKRLLKINTDTNAIEAQYSGHQDWVLTAAIGRSAQTFASGSFKGEIRLWSASNASMLQAWIAQP